MNIKNREAERLTRELAQATGESMTAAITEAVRERLERIRASHRQHPPGVRAARLLEIGQEIAPLLPEPWASRDHGELLYDDAGLPG